MIARYIARPLSLVLLLLCVLGGRAEADMLNNAAA